MRPIETMMRPRKARFATWVMRSTHQVVIGLILLAGATVSLVWAGGIVNAEESYLLEEGETRHGDLYLFSGRVVIDGTLDGDLIFFGMELEINGTVTGTVNAWAQRVTLNGDFHDTARIFAQSIEVAGNIEGDLLAYGQSVSIAEGARIDGDATACGAEVQISGEIVRDLDSTGGMIVMQGRVGGDAELKADVVKIESGARIEGDLDYVSRHRADFDELAVVGGAVDWAPGDRDVRVTTDVGGGWIFCLLAAVIVGLAAIALFSRQVPGIVSLAGKDGLRCAGVGFITSVVVPVALALACILIITIPLVIIGFVVFGLLVYLAKVPVAVWAGQWILGRFGRPQASPYVALLTGMPVLYLLFLIPYLGRIAWFACLFVGLGAVVLHAMELRRQRTTPGGMTPTAPAQPPPPAIDPTASPQPS